MFMNKNKKYENDSFLTGDKSRLQIRREKCENEDIKNESIIEFLTIELPSSCKYFFYTSSNS